MTERATYIEHIGREELLSKIKEMVEDAFGKAPKHKPSPPKENNKEVFNLKEAAKYLGSTPRSVYGKAKSGKIKYSKDGKLFFTKENLNQYIKDHEK